MEGAAKSTICFRNFSPQALHSGLGCFRDFRNFGPAAVLRRTRVTRAGDENPARGHFAFCDCRAAPAHYSSLYDAAQLTEYFNVSSLLVFLHMSRALSWGLSSARLTSGGGLRPLCYLAVDEVTHMG